MNHTLYIRGQNDGRTIKELIKGTANYLGVPVRLDQIMIVETDDADLAHLVRTLATANGELLDLVDPAALLQPSGLKTREEIEQEERDFWEKHNLIEKGEGRLMVISNEDHAELHSPKPVMEMVAEVAEPPDPPAKKARKPRTYKPRQCEVCGQMYTPTGPRAKHKDCPGKVNGAEPQPAEEPIGTVTTWDEAMETLQPGDTLVLPEGEIYRTKEPVEDLPAEKPAGDALASKPVAQGDVLPYWERLLTGEMIENNTLLRMVGAGEYPVGERFDNAEAGLHEVAKRKSPSGVLFYLELVKVSAPVGDRE